MRLGIYGGSFDPVHNGHLALALACQRRAALDEVWFTPAAIQPFKHRGPHATDAQRVEMLQLAIDQEPTWRVCTLEIDRGGVSYTVDTLRQIHVELPEAKLFFLIGADALCDLPHWREPEEIFRLATPLVVRRAGQSEPDLTTLAALCRVGTAHQAAKEVNDDGGQCPPYALIEMPAIDISSTEIRRRVANHEPIDGLVPPTVAEYIARHDLYCSAGE